MSGIALVTDSTCDFSAESRSRCKATIMPLHVSVGQAEYLDGVDIEPDVFYRRFAGAGQSGETLVIGEEQSG